MLSFYNPSAIKDTDVKLVMYVPDDKVVADFPKLTV